MKRIKRVRKNTSKTRSAGNYCDKCGYRIRGKNHEEGEQHKKGKDGKIVKSTN